MKRDTNTSAVASLSAGGVSYWCFDQCICVFGMFGMCDRVCEVIQSIEQHGRQAKRAVFYLRTLYVVPRPFLTNIFTFSLLMWFLLWCFHFFHVHGNRHHLACQPTIEQSTLCFSGWNPTNVVGGFLTTQQMGTSPALFSVFDWRSISIVFFDENGEVFRHIGRS